MRLDIRYVEDGSRFLAYTENLRPLTCCGGVFGISGMPSLKRYFSESFLLYVARFLLSVERFCVQTYLPPRPGTGSTRNPNVLNLDTVSGRTA